MSKVYIKTDAGGRILACDGGYSEENMGDMTSWTLLDEGEGDRYNLCQSNYFDDLYTDDGIPRYKYADGAAVLRSEAEIEEDVAALPPPPPSPLEQAQAEAAVYKAALEVLGVNTEEADES